MNTARLHVGFAVGQISALAVTNACKFSYYKQRIPLVVIFKTDIPFVRFVQVTQLFTNTVLLLRIFQGPSLEFTEFL